MIFRQLIDIESSTLTYILADEISREALIIDPVLENYERDLALINDLELNLLYILETHIHADHITSARKLAIETQAKIAISSTSGHKKADLLLEDEQIVSFGKYNLLTIHTPGHTNGCCSFYCDEKLFTGDTLFIRGCGRTDFQSGDSATLYQSVTEKLYCYPDETAVYPGHDYKGRLSTSIGEEKKHNPRLKLSNNKEDFIKLMDDLKLDLPIKLKTAVPANLQGGTD
jgi:sulfur dioxygenase